MTCFCINPDCPDPERPDDEDPCKACGSDLLLQGRYRVTRVLHRKDRMIGVYEIADRKDKNQPKVLKVLSTENEDAISRFNRAADFSMNHQIVGIPKVEPGGYFLSKFPLSSLPAYCLVMEKIEGENLEQWLKNQHHQKLEIKRGINWLKQLAIILEFLHRYKFFHQDIKPSNIVLREEDEQLFLIDLGGVRAALQKALNEAPVKTSEYMAPEQQKGLISAQSDFYGLGLSFVYLLTGIEPRRLYQGWQGKLLWKQEATPLSKQFIELVNCLITDNSQKRPKTATDILNQLLVIEKNIQVSSNKPSFFKLLIGGMVFATIAGMAYLAIQSPDRQQSPVVRTSTPIHPCKIRQTTQQYDQAALAKDVQAYLNNLSEKDIQEYNPNQTRIDLHHVKQQEFNSEQCDVLISITFADDIPLDTAAKVIVAERIKKNFPSVNYVRIDP